MADLLELHTQLGENDAETDQVKVVIVSNYAALGTAWILLAEFSGIASDQNQFPDDLIQEMNTHIIESRANREPRVLIMEIILGEIDWHEFKSPFKFEQADDDMWLLIRPTHIMQHLSQTSSLRAKFDAIPVKTAKVLQSNWSAQA